MIYENENNDLDRMVTFLEKAVKKEEEKFKNHNGRHRFSPLMSGLISETLVKMHVPVAGIEHIIKSGQQMSELLVKKVKKQIQQNPDQFLATVAVGSLAVGVIAVYFWKKKSKAKEVK